MGITTILGSALKNLKVVSGVLFISAMILLALVMK